MQKKFAQCREAALFLSKSDPKLKSLVKKVGSPEALRYHAKRDVFEALATAIVYQQLHAKAAETILNRFLELFPQRDGFPAPETILKHDVESLMKCGLSRAKARGILDLSQKSWEGKIPGRKEAAKLSNEELIERLTEVRGIGRWTVEMFLIFTLGRPDILPVHDFGVRKGYMLAFGKRKMPSPRDLEKLGLRWSPHRTVLSWYLWRATDLAKERRL